MLKKLLKANLMNLMILGLIVGFFILCNLLFPDREYPAMNSIVNVMTFIMGGAWAAYTIYYNVTVIKESDIEKMTEVRERLKAAGNKKYFVNERTHLLNMLDSLENRKKYFMSSDDDKLKDLYQMTRNQMIRNATNVSEYIESFDYIAGQDSGYAKEMCDNSQDLLNRFNKLVELSVTYDDTTLDYDTREIDDMIESLQEMRDTGKARLGS